jgi:GNAT superfamily N-acetyltransferase
MSEYLCEGDVHRDCSASVTKAYIVLLDEVFVGYFAVLSDSIRLQGKEKPKGIPYPSGPAIKLGRMAVAKEYRGQGIGEWILKYVVGMARDISGTVGVRYVTLDALPRPKLIAWYERNGFVRNKAETRTQKLLRGLKNPEDLPHVSMRRDLFLKSELPAVAVKID